MEPSRRFNGENKGGRVICTNREVVDEEVFAGDFKDDADREGAVKEKACLPHLSNKKGGIHRVTLARMRRMP